MLEAIRKIPDRAFVHSHLIPTLVCSVGAQQTSFWICSTDLCVIERMGENIKVFSKQQQVLHLMASVQYLKTSFICGKKPYVKKFADAAKLHVWRRSIFDANGIP